MILYDSILKVLFNLLIDLTIHIVFDRVGRNCSGGKTYEEMAVIKRLNVRNLAKTCFLSSIMTDCVETHSYSSLYIEEENDLDWDSLFTVLKNNAERKQEEIIEQIEKSENIEDKEYYQSIMIEKLKDEDLKLWINQFHAFVLIAKEDVPGLDIKRLACILENYIVGYEPFSVDSDAYAYVDRNQMTYPLWMGYYPDFRQFIQKNDHEFYHLINSACVDEENDLGHIWCAGISINASTRYDKDFIKEHHLLDEGFRIYFPFDYAFLEEGNAERYSCSILNMNPETYFDSQFTISNLELSLFLQPGFKVENLRKANMLHNPIALIQQFPILNDYEGKEDEWLYSQLEMLECYNIINETKKLVNFCWDVYEENPDKMDEAIASRISILENYADLQCLRNFVWTLVNVGYTDRKKMTLEDCYYIMHLFEARIEMQRKIVCKTYGFESLDTEIYLLEKEKLFELLQESLQLNYPIDIEIVGRYHDYDYENGQLSGAFSEEEKRYLMQLYSEMDDYYEWVSELEDADKETISEKRKSYYIIP